MDLFVPRRKIGQDLETWKGQFSFFFTGVDEGSSFGSFFVSLQICHVFVIEKVFLGEESLSII